MKQILCTLLLSLAAFAASATDVRVSALFGVVVLDERGERVGKLRDLALDVDGSFVAYATIESESPDSIRAVPLSSLRPSIHNGRLVYQPGAAAGASGPRSERLLWASTLVGMPIRHPTGADYGVIRNLVVDLDTARVERVVVVLEAAVEVERDLPLSALRFPPAAMHAILTLKAP